jgi:hypothetical protein
MGERSCEKEIARNKMRVINVKEDRNEKERNEKDDEDEIWGETLMWVSNLDCCFCFHPFMFAIVNVFHPYMFASIKKFHPHMVAPLYVSFSICLLPIFCMFLVFIYFY